MGAAENRGKNSAMAAHLKAMGIWHGRRMTKGIDNMPKPGDVGSAAYRRLIAKRRNGGAS